MQGHNLHDQLPRSLQQLLRLQSRSQHLNQLLLNQLSNPLRFKNHQPVQLLQLLQR